MGKIINLTAEEEEEDAEEFRADTDTIRCTAWRLYLDAVDEAEFCGITPLKMIVQMLLCWLSDRL